MGVGDSVQGPRDVQLVDLLFQAECDRHLVCLSPVTDRSPIDHGVHGVNGEPSFARPLTDGQSVDSKPRPHVFPAVGVH